MAANADETPGSPRLRRHTAAASRSSRGSRPNHPEPCAARAVVVGRGLTVSGREPPKISREIRDGSTHSRGLTVNPRLQPISPETVRPAPCLWKADWRREESADESPDPSMIPCSQAWPPISRELRPWPNHLRITPIDAPYPLLLRACDSDSSNTPRPELQQDHQADPASRHPVHPTGAPPRPRSNHHRITSITTRPKVRWDIPDPSGQTNEHSIPTPVRETRSPYAVETHRNRRAR